MGRPTKYKPEYCERIIELSSDGKSIAQCCADLKISRDTWHEWKKNHTDFSDAVKKAEQLRETWWTQMGLAAMTGKAKVNGEIVKVNSTMFIWLSKNVVGWRDKLDIKEQDDDEYDFRIK